MPSSSSTHSDASAAKVRIAESEPSKHRVVEDPLLDAKPQMYDWSRVKSCGCCGCFSFLLQLILVAASGSFLFGLNLSLLNTSVNHIAWEFDWCERMTTGKIIDCDKAQTYKAFISTAVFIGAAIASMGGGAFMAFGRRGMLLISMGVFVFGIVSCVCANSFSALVWARLLCGFAVGLVSVASPTYMSEFTPAAVRGFYGVFHQLFITVGILVGSLLGLPLAFKNPVPDEPTLEAIDSFSKVWWRVMLGFGIIPVLILVWALLFNYSFETPHYYVENGSHGDAEQILMRVTGKSDVSEELREIVTDIETSQAARAAGMSLGQAWKRPDYRYVIIYGCLLSAFQQFSGINVFIASSNDLFQEVGLKDKWPTIMSNIMNLVNCVMTMPAVPLIERLGRRTLMVVGTLAMTIGVAPAAICFWALDDGNKTTQWLALIGCMVFIVGFACTYGPILWVYLFEIYPTEIKGAAAGLATAFNWVAGIIMVFVTQYLSGKVKWLLFMILCGCGSLIVFFGMKETKGRKLGDSPYINH